MEQPVHDLRPFQHTAAKDVPSRAVGVTLVVLIHLLAIYGLASGLAQNLARKTIQEFKAEVIPPKQEEVKPPPPPPPELQKPPPPFVPPPDIVIQSEAPPQNTITVQKQVASLPPPPKQVVAPPVSQPALIEGGAGKCESSYYPAVAQRLEQTGTTTVAVHIGADGSVQSVNIVNSSGHDSLDEASVRCISSTWRYRPATQNGQAVPTVKEYAIKWVLQ
jgi:periplasmic protein TonB